eukprot:14529007-Ditylum_brightwellii.AAC.1
MAPEGKGEATPDVIQSLWKAGQPSRGEGRGQVQKMSHFQGSCEELKGWVFYSTDSQGTDNFNTVREEIA